MRLAYCHRSCGFLLAADVGVWDVGGRRAGSGCGGVCLAVGQYGREAGESWSLNDAMDICLSIAVVDGRSRGSLL